MMPVSRKAINILVGVLAAQAVLALLLLLPRTQDQDPLVTYDLAGVDQIRIAGGGEEGAIEMTLNEGEWLMNAGLPVDASRIEALTEVLGSDRWSWPVASTGDAAKRFEVTDENFQRRVELLAGEAEIATLFLGTSPGFRRIHAREADSDKIYSIELATYDLPLDEDDWLDKSLIEAPGSVDSIARPGLFRAELAGEGEWALMDASLPASSSEFASMATRFETLRVMGLAEEVPENAPDLEFEVSAAGVDIRYAFYRPPAEDDDEAEDNDAEFSTSVRDTLVKSSLRDEFFRVSSFTVDQLDKALEDLTEAPEQVPESAETGEGEQAE